MERRRNCSAAHNLLYYITNLTSDGLSAELAHVVVQEDAARIDSPAHVPEGLPFGIERAELVHAAVVDFPPMRPAAVIEENRLGVGEVVLIGRLGGFVNRDRDGLAPEGGTEGEIVGRHRAIFDAQVICVCFSRTSRRIS